MRDFDCPKYKECLEVAAKANQSLNCQKCRKDNIENNSEPPDGFGQDEISMSLKEISLLGNKNPAAVALGHLGGLKGGPARAKALSKEERVRIARKAARVRWGNIQLLDCPFCHGTNLEFEKDLAMVGDFTVVCEKCGVLGPTGRNKEEAIRKWNG